LRHIARAIKGQVWTERPEAACGRLDRWVVKMKSKDVLQAAEVMLTEMTLEEAMELIEPRTFHRLFGWREVREGIDLICRAVGGNHTELANLLKVDKCQVSRWYNGKTAPSPEIRHKLEFMVGVAGMG
jgi:DNA-binding transcriptional regulator YdaS (Cro superfamily)